MPSTASVCGWRRAICFGVKRLRIGVHDPWASVPPAVSRINCAARWLAQSQMPMSAPRSKRYEDSVRSSSFLEVARMFCGLKQALSISTSAVLRLISLFWPPMTPASATALVSSAIRSIWLVRVRSWPSRVLNFSPSAARRMTIVGQASPPVRGRRDACPTLEQVIIKRVQRLADFEHHVVGHIHHVVDAADADLLQRALQPIRARGDLHAAHHARRVTRAQLRIFDPHRHQFFGPAARFAKLDLRAASADYP